VSTAGNRSDVFYVEKIPDSQKKRKYYFKKQLST